MNGDAVLHPVFSDPDSPQTTATPDGMPAAVTFQPAPNTIDDPDRGDLEETP